MFLISSNVQFLGSIVVSIPVCHTGDRGSIPRQGVFFFFFLSAFFEVPYFQMYSLFAKDNLWDQLTHSAPQIPKHTVPW